MVQGKTETQWHDYYQNLERASQETIDRAAVAYVECAQWATVFYDENGDEVEMSGPMPLSLETASRMQADVIAFFAECWGGVWDDCEVDLSELEPEQVGHDFWLTRNRHGAGFWDRGLGELGDRLTEMAHAYGEMDLYLGDDETIGHV